MLKIYVNNEQDKVEIPLEDIERIALSVFKAANLDADGELSVTITDDETIAELNEQYREVEGPTDVLSFPQCEGMEMAVPEDPDYCPLIGDVVISAPTTMRQAEEAGHSFMKEMTILLIHGILHLFGYDHSDEYQQSIMHDEEQKILDQVMAENEKVFS